MSDKVNLTKDQREELDGIILEITEEAVSVKLDYEQNESNLDSGSLIAVHQNSSLLDDENEELSDIAYDVRRKK